MTTEATDLQFMQRALALARQGIGLASPNPCVGAVVVDAAGQILGEGTHIYAGRKHAEVLALEQAGERALGATLYLNLEPCCHTGRTGPCVDTVIASGVARVVAGMSDPNPLVAGKGFEKLRAAGIEVIQGILEADARKLNEAFAIFIRTRTPFVILKAGMTLDGKLAAPSLNPHLPMAGRCGAPARPEKIEAERWITGEAARAHAQRELRHASDAILVGIGTVLADDPLLTDRSGLPRGRPLFRVVLDSHLRLPLDSQLVRSADNDLLVFHTSGSQAAVQELEARGVRVESIASDASGCPDLAAVLRRLGELNVLSLLIEGGSTINWAALAFGLVDKVFLYYAPKMFIPAVRGCGVVPLMRPPADAKSLSGEAPAPRAEAGFRPISDVVHLKSMQLHRFGDDFAVEGYIRDPY